MTSKIRHEDFEIIPIMIACGDTEYAVNFRGRTFVITNDREVAQNCLDCQLKNELRYEQIRNEDQKRDQPDPSIS